MKILFIAALSCFTLTACANHEPNVKFVSECSFSLDGDKPLTFYIDGDNAILRGVVCDGSPDAFEEMLYQYPNVKTLVFNHIDGSADDEANTELGLMVRNAGMNTLIEKNGHIASGGTDLFLAGVERTVEHGAKIGVHSWAVMGGPDGDQLPREHVEHQRYLEYYRALGINQDFYWYTLQSAPASGMHYMSAKELRQYGFSTE